MTARNLILADPALIAVSNRIVTPNFDEKYVADNIQWDAVVAATPTFPVLAFSEPYVADGIDWEKITVPSPTFPVVAFNEPYDVPPWAA